MKKFKMHLIEKVANSKNPKDFKRLNVDRVTYNFFVPSDRTYRSLTEKELEQDLCDLVKCFVSNKFILKITIKLKY